MTGTPPAPVASIVVVAQLPGVVTQFARFVSSTESIDVRGLYVYGSATVDGLQPGSDIDLLLVTGTRARIWASC